MQSFTIQEQARLLTLLPPTPPGKEFEIQIPKPISRWIQRKDQANQTFGGSVFPEFDSSVVSTLGARFDQVSSPSIGSSFDLSIRGTSDPSIDSIVDSSSDPTIVLNIGQSFYTALDPIVDPSIDLTFNPADDPSIHGTLDPSLDDILDPLLDPELDPSTEPILVYSRSYNTWFTGKVEGLGYDEDGEFFEIHYTNDTTGKHMIKYLNRFDPHLRRIGGQTPVLRTPRIRRRPPSQNCEYPILNKRSDRSSNVPKRHSINKKPLGLQVGLLQQDVVDELLRGKIRGLFSSSSTDAKIEGFGDAKIPEYSDSEGMEDEMIDAFIEERNHLACSTNYHSSISSEMPHQMSVGADFDGVDFDEQAEEVRGGGRVASDDDESESEETLRLAWLDAEEFENFFKCSLSGFLRRFQYYE